MPQYDVRLSDGRTVRVNAPEGATQEQIGALAFQTNAPRENRVDLLRQDAERRRRIAEEQLAANRRRRAVEETGLLGQLVRGVGAGAVGMTGTALQGAAELLPNEYEEPVQEGIAGLVDYLRPELLVGEDEGSTAQQIAATFGQALGSTAPLIAAGAVGGLPAAAALGAGAGAGEAGQRARRAGASDEEQMLAVLQGTGVGLTEAGPLGAVARLFRPAAKAASIIAPKLDPGWRAKAKAAYDYTVRKAGPAAAEEAAQESIASSLQNLIERGYNPEQDIFDAGVFEEGAYGAGVGATIQALADLAIRGRNRRTINEAYAEDEARAIRSAEEARRAAELQEAEGIAAAEGEDYLDSLVGQFRDQAAREEAMRAGAADMLRRGTTAPAAPETVPEIPEPQPNETFEEYRARVEQQMRAGREGLERARQKEELARVDEDVADVLSRAAVGTEPEARAASARERLDEDQADLFPVELEQTLLEDGPATGWRPEPDIPPVTPETPETQLTIFDQIEQEKARLRRESELFETDARTFDAERARNRARRLRVLQDVVENTPTRQDTTLIKAFRRALTDAGFTETAPLPAERRLIKRAIDFQRAQPVDEGPVPSSADLAALESAVPERRTAAPESAAGTPEEQLGLDLGPLPERAEEAPAGPRPVRSLEEALEGRRPLPPQRLTAGRLSELGVPETREVRPGRAPTPGTALRAAVEGKDINEPGVQDALAAFVRASRGQQVATNIARILNATPETQAELFPAPAGTRRRGRPVEPEPEPDPVPEPERPKSTFGFLMPVPDMSILEVAQLKDSAAVKYTLFKNRYGAGYHALSFTDKRTGRGVTWMLDDTGRVMGTDVRGEDKGYTYSDGSTAQSYESKRIPKDVTSQVREELGLGEPTPEPVTPEVTEEAPAPNKQKVVPVPVAARNQDDEGQLRQTLGANDIRRVDMEARFANTRAPEPVPDPDVTTTPTTGDPVADAARERAKQSFELQRRFAVRGTAVEGLEPTVKDPDPLNRGDYVALSEVLEGGPRAGGDKAVQAVYRYFSRYPSPLNALRAIVHEVTTKVPNFSKTTEPDYIVELRKETGGVHARRALEWVQENLNAGVQEWVGREAIRQQQLSESLGKLDATDQVKAARQAEAKRIRDLEAALTREAKKAARDEGKFAAEVVNEIIDATQDAPKNLTRAVDQTLHPAVELALENGDFAGALTTLADTIGNGFLKSVARKLSRYVGNTQLELVEGLRSSTGAPIAGRFSPQENKIYLDRARGMNAHTMLHEMVHAAVSATLSNKSSPTTKQLTRLFDEVQGRLSGTYAATDVDEFVSEVMSNPELQSDLARIALTPNIIGRLVEGKPSTDGYTFWDYIKNVIGNAIRRATGRTPIKLGESLTQNVSRLVDDIMAPAPEYRGAPDLAMSTFPGQLKNQILDRIVAANAAGGAKNPTAKQEWINKAGDFLDSGASNMATSLFTKAMPLTALIGISENYGLAQNAKQLDDAIRMKEGAVVAQRINVEAVMKSLTAWAKEAGADAYATFNALVMDSTLAEVDPTKPRSAYAKNAEKLAEWDKLNPQYMSLSEAGRQGYKDLRDTYKRMFDELLENLETRIMDVVGEESQERARSVAARLRNEIVSSGRIEPYFPLFREGDFWIEYELDGADKPVKEAFQTDQARKGRLLELQKYPEVSSARATEMNVNKFLPAGAPPSTFIGQVLEVVPESSREEILDLYLKTLPENAIARGFQKRSGFLGAKEDSIYVLQNRGMTLARQLANLKGNTAIDQAIADLQKAVPQADARSTRAVVRDQLIERGQFAKNPPRDGLAKEMNRWAFLYTLGGNVSSAILNLSQIPLIVMPYLGGKYGYSGVRSETGKAYRAFLSSGMNHALEMGLNDANGNPRFVSAKAMPSIDNYYVTDAAGNYVIRDDITVPAEMRAYLEEVAPMVKAAGKRGMLNRSLIYDTLGIEEVGPKSTLWEQTNAISGGMFHIAERANRQTTLLTSYRLELARLTKDEPGLSQAQREQKAIEDAIYNTELLNGSSMLSTAPQLAQQGVGRVALMYKSFGISMYYLLAKTARAMVDGSVAPEDRKVAMKQLAGIHLSALLLAGVQGMPIYGIASMIWGLFMDDDEVDPDTITRQAIGEGWWKGPVAALSGLDASTRIGLTDLLWRNNPYNRDASPEETIVSILGGPAMSVGLGAWRGAQNLVTAETGDEYSRAIESLLPAALRNPLQVARFTAQGGIKTRRGDPIYDDIGPFELAGKMLGFAPTEYTRRQEESLLGKRIEAEVRDRRQRLYRRNYMAYMNGDFDEMKEIREEIREFNARHPDAAITEDTLDRSIESNLQTNLDRRYNGVIYDELTKEEVMRQINEFRPGFWPFM